MSGNPHTARCPMCGTGQRLPGATTVTLTRGDATLVTRGVPAQVCDVCGTDYLDEATTAKLHQQAEASIAAGVKYEVREYAAKMA